ncbi:extracellular mutant protein 11-domain-containing protein [Pyrenochaeta sp. MPI-SDFR-AT-0127]|nr:extracellular mutant protein 11-domain-containing protein [Pyrenochaeta sp. MPI-SDFR-AT-0127]
MQNFVKDRDRAGSPQSAQNGHLNIMSKRQASAANARIPLKKGYSVQQPQPQSVIPTRGLGNAQNSSASGQGQGQERDPYDTDAESLDTTVNHSVMQIEDDRIREQQHQQQGQVLGLGDELDGDEGVSEKGSEEDEFEDYEWTQDDIQLIEQAGLQAISREGQLSFLQQVRLNGFPMVDGDSYPTTTNGDPTEWEGGQEAIPEDQNYGALVSPSPQRATANNHLARPFASPLPQRDSAPNIFGSNPGMHKSNIFQQSASLRGQQRSTPQPAQPVGSAYQSIPLGLPLSQRPNYGQSSHETVPDLPASSNVGRNTQTQPSISLYQTHRPPPPGPVSVHLQPTEPHALLKKSSARPKTEPAVQHEPTRQVPIEETAVPVSDYDSGTLFAMSYDRLKNEDFDTDPRAGPQALTDDILRKPLLERLEFVQKNLDASKQLEFFSSLPIIEWEESGDWFLDQFQSIIQRTKEARQNKRKLAQEFEKEVEKRYTHVSKKQHQVEDAMKKMKTQGEGLVPKSPRHFKSPKS